MAAPPQQAPSPMFPAIVLFIVATMMTMPSLMTYDPNYWNSQVAQVQTHFVLGAFLIPICLALLVQAFGLPKVNPVTPVEQRTNSPIVDSMTQNLGSSILLVVVIISLLILIPIRSSLMQLP